MKRIIDSSKTLTHQLVRSNSKSRRPFSRDFNSSEKIPSKLQKSVIPSIKRNISVSSLDGRDDGVVDLDVSKHNMPEKLNWYWNLDEDHKRKITDPTYVRQAVQDTFMQRAQGGYHYKRTPSSRNNFSSKPPLPRNEQKSEISAKPSRAMTVKPPPPLPDKIFPKPQVPKRKRLIDTAKPIQLRPKAQPEQRKAKLGAHLKEAGQKQLEEAKKKLYDPAPAVLDYLIEKHVPKMSGLQLRSRKDKPATEDPQLPAVPSIMQRVLGWRGKDESKKNDSDISITPRSIEVRKKSAKVTEPKQTRKTESAKESAGKTQKKKRSGKLRLSFRENSAKKEIPESEKKKKKSVEKLEDKSARQTQAEEDRDVIWGKMKASTAPVVRATQEVASVKKQVRDFELTPQIYPKGSLSMRKSYLPITACRPRMDISRPTEAHSSVYSVKHEEKPPPVQESPSITDHILDSLKNIFSKMRRNSA